MRAARYLDGAEVCWAYNGAALELFEIARSRRIRCVLEQALAPYEEEARQLELVRRDWPGWEDGKAGRQIRARVSEFLDPLERRERAEWQLADVVVAGSPYVKDCLAREGVPDGKSIVVPSGVDLDKFAIAAKAPNANRPLRVLFVGEVGLRKGVPYLLEAVRRLDSRKLDLKLVGPIRIACGPLRSFRRWAEFAGTVPRSKILSCYGWADVLVCPSVCEGSAMVTYEARACGVPIVATPNSGAFFTPGVDGIEIPVRDSSAIAEILDRLASGRGELERLKRGAVQLRSSLGQEAYRTRIASLLEGLFKIEPP